MKTFSLEELLKSGAHFGHQKSRWHPKMKQFIFTDRSGVHIINLEKTQEELTKVLGEVRQMAAEGKIILFVSTKPHAREIVKAAALDCGMPFLVDRWIGGMLTNFSEIKNLLKKYLSYKEGKESGEWEKYTKKEQLEKGKSLTKMDSYLSGLSNLTKMPDALFVPTVQHEKTTITEANSTNVPVIGVCDTNTNPEKITYMIPGNDDAVSAIKLFTEAVAEAIKEGRAEYENNLKKEVKAKTVKSLN